MKRLLFTILVLVLSACVPARTDTISPSEYLNGMIQNEQSHLQPSRPQHAGMLNKEDLQPGMFVKRIESPDQADKLGGDMLILSKIYTVDGDCRFNAVTILDTGYSQFWDADFCADSGLTEYHGLLHGWNTYYLVQSDRKPLSQAEVDKLMSTLTPTPGIDVPLAPESQSS